jgi:hypothetical protein
MATTRLLKGIDLAIITGTVTTTPADFPHALGRVPIAVLATAIDTASATPPTWDQDNSDDKTIRLVGDQQGGVSFVAWVVSSGQHVTLVE